MRKVFHKLVLLSTVITFIFALHISAQITPNSQWTWIKGDSIAYQSGVYGTQGTPSAANKPGSREYSVSWKDGIGNLWLFGGYGWAAYGWGYGGLNDLWSLGKDGFIWVGITSTNWTVGSNWSGGVVPGPDDDATIPGGTPFSAIVPNGITVSCRSLTITTGAIVTIGINARLNVMQ